MKPSKDDVFQSLIKIYQKNWQSDFVLEENQILRDDVGLDSLDTIELAIEIEKEFNISIPDQELEDWYTVEDVLETIYKLI